jgi:hypothetical protein
LDNNIKGHTQGKKDMTRNLDTLYSATEIIISFSWINCPRSEHVLYGGFGKGVMNTTVFGSHREKIPEVFTPMDLALTFQGRYNQ